MKKYIAFTFGLLLVPTLLVFAQNSNTQATLNNPLGDVKDIPALVAAILKLVAQFGAIVCVFFIIYAGFLFVKAQGNDKELEHAKSVLLWSIVGTAVLLGASVVADVIRGTVEEVTGSKIPTSL